MSKRLIKVLIINGLWVSGLMFVTEAPHAQNTPQAEKQAMSEAQKLLIEADAVFNAYKYDEARDIYQKALKAAEEAGNNSDITEAQSMIARTYLTADDLQTTAEWLGKAEKTAEKNEPLGWSRYQSVAGRMLWKEKKLEQAARLFEDLHGYCSQRKLYDRAVDAANMVTITGAPNQQIEWGKKGIAEAEAGGVTGRLGPLWNNLGASYEDRKEYDKALEAYQKARKYHRQYGSEVNKMIADWAVGHAYRLLGNYDEALAWLKPVLAWCERIEENEFIGLTCRELGEIDYVRQRHETAYEHFVRAEKLLGEAGMDNWDPDGYKAIQNRIIELQNHK